MPIRNWAELLEDAGTEGGDYQPIPAGEYNFEIVKAEATKTSNDKSMFKVHCKVEDQGPHQGRLVFNNFVVSPESAKALSIFFRQMAVLGLDKNFFNANPTDEVIAQHLMNKRFRGTVTIGEWNGSPKNELSGLSTPIDQASVAGTPQFPGPAAQPQAQPQPQVAPAPAPQPQQYQQPAPAPQPQQQAPAPAPQQYQQPAPAPQQQQQPPAAPPAPPVGDNNVPPPPPF